MYQAQESGLTYAQIVDFLHRHSQREAPANVLRSLADWAGKRESLSLRSGVTVLGFPSTADRDAYLESHPGAACGERYVLAAASGKARPESPRFIESDHLLARRRTLELDEHGRIGTVQVLDVVQFARLRRIALPTASGWQLTGDSVRHAAAGGLEPALIHQWLNDHLVHPAPPVITLAIDTWAGKSRSLELADAILLHVPDDKLFQAIKTSQRFSPPSAWLPRTALAGGQSRIAQRACRPPQRARLQPEPATDASRTPVDCSNTKATNRPRSTRV